MKQGLWLRNGLLAAAAGLGLALSAQAEVYVWDGSDGLYNDATNWVGGVVPDLNASSNTALIAGGAVVYVPGGDLPIHNGSTLQISGGSYTQTNGTSWMQMSGGNLVVDGGVFDQGTCNNIVRDADSSITVSAGTAYLRDFNNDLSYNPASYGSFSLSGTGTVYVPDTFKPVEAFTMSGGTLIVEDISFAGTSDTITLTGGRIEVDADDGLGYNGIYSDDSSTDFINFTAGSTGEFFFQNYTLTELNDDGMLTNGRIVYEGAVNADAFEAVEADGGVLVSLLSETNTVPTGVTASAGDGQVELSWSGVVDADSYNIKRSESSGGSYDVIGSTNATSYTDSSAVNGTTYYYVIAAVIDGSEGGDSDEVSAAPLKSAPVGFVAYGGDDEIQLYWGAVTDADSYVLRRSLVSGGPYNVEYTPSSASYTDTAVTNGTTYYYTVASVEGGVESEASSEISAAPGMLAPADVEAVAGDTQVSLSWTASSGAESYNVKRSEVSGGPYTTVLSTNATTAVDTGLSNGTTYYYVVSAVGASGESGDSDEVSAEPNLYAPTGFAAVSGDGQVSLSWDAAVGALSYNVKRSETSGGPYTTVASPTGTSTVDSGLVNGTVYYYVISSVGTSGESGDSDEISGEPNAVTVYVWGGSDGEYTAASNWVGGVVPDLSSGNATAQINGGAVTHTPTSDLQIHDGSTLQISGGSWTQTNATKWLQLAGGNLLVDGGVFDQGTCNHIVRDSGSSITVSSGKAYLRDVTDNYYYDPSSYGSFEVSGSGSVEIADTFRVVEAFSIGSGTLIVENISFAGTSGPINLTGGRIEVDASSGSYNGIYSDGDTDYVNFTTNSYGAFFFQNYTLTELEDDGMLTNGRIVHNGAVDETAFNAVEVDGGVEITLVDAGEVPIEDDEYVIASFSVDGDVLTLVVDDSVETHSYQVLATESLSIIDWQPVGDAQSGDSLDLTFEITIEEGSTQYYYKLDVQQE